MIMSVQYEDIVNDFDNVVPKIFKHCGLEYTEKAKTFHKTNRIVDTNSAGQVRKPLYKSGMGQWQKFDQGSTAPFLAGLKQSLQKFYDHEI